MSGHAKKVSECSCALVHGCDYACVYQLCVLEAVLLYLGNCDPLFTRQTLN